MIEALILGTVTFAVPLDLQLTPTQPSAKVGDFVDIGVYIINDSPDAQSFCGVTAGLVYDPAVLAPRSMTTCDSPLPFFMAQPMMGFCINEGDEWPDPDGDLMIQWKSPLGTEADAFAMPQLLFTVRFEVVGEGNAEVAFTQPEDIPDHCLPDPSFWETRVYTGANDVITGDISDTAEIDVRIPADVDGNGTVDILDLLAVLQNWG